MARLSPYELLLQAIVCVCDERQTWDQGAGVKIAFRRQALGWFLVLPSYPEQALVEGGGLTSQHS